MRGYEDHRQGGGVVRTTGREGGCEDHRQGGGYELCLFGASSL